MKKLAAVGFILMLLWGCALQGDRPVRVVVENEVRTRVVNEEALAPADAVRQHNAPMVPVIGAPVRTMAGQIEAGLKAQGIKRLPITVVPFVDLTQPEQPHALGAELAEGFYHELRVRGFNLVDYSVLPFAERRTGADVSLPGFYRSDRISYVVTGTYMVNADGIIINARVLDTVSRQVVATGQSHLPTRDLEGSLPGYNPLGSRDGMIVENGGVPAR